MKVLLLVLLIAFNFSCQGQTAPRTEDSNNQNNSVDSRIVQNSENTNSNEDVINTISLTCGDKEYVLSEIYKGTMTFLNIKNDEKTIKSITFSVLSEPYVSLESVDKTKPGFQISVEYGSRFHYWKKFDFVCKQNQFYLSKVITTTFDKHNPETTWKEYSKNLSPNLLLEKFVLTNYLKE